MICLAYLSSAQGVPDPGDLERILTASRRNNAARGVTGMLCHYDGSFLQFLEGEADQVEATFRTILADDRHAGVLEVFRGPIEERMFPDWTMALAKPGDVGPEHRAFCHSLRQLELAVGPQHRGDLAPFLESFRAWLR